MAAIRYAGLCAGAVCLLAAAACRDAHRGAHLVAAVDQLHPGSRITVQERVVEDARTIEVTIGTREIASDVARLGREAREVARAMRDHAGLGPRDTVVVVFRSEGGPALAQATRRARLAYPVSELGAEVEGP